MNKKKRIIFKMILINIVGLAIVCIMIMPQIITYIKGKTLEGTIKRLETVDTGFREGEDGSGNIVYNEVPIVSVIINGLEKEIILKEYCNGSIPLLIKKIDGINVFKKGDKLKIRYMEKEDKAVIENLFIFRETTKVFKSIWGCILLVITGCLNTKFRNQLGEVNKKEEAKIVIISNGFLVIMLVLMLPIFLIYITKSLYNIIGFSIIFILTLGGAIGVKTSIKILKEEKIREEKYKIRI